MDSVKNIKDELEDEGYVVYRFSWGGSLESVLVTSTGGLQPERFIDQDTNRICTTFINIMVRSQDMQTGLNKIKAIYDYLEANVINGMISNKPKWPEPRFLFSENTELGTVYYFGFDANALFVESNN